MRRNSPSYVFRSAAIYFPLFAECSANFSSYPKLPVLLLMKILWRWEEREREAAALSGQGSSCEKLCERKETFLSPFILFYRRRRPNYSRFTCAVMSYHVERLVKRTQDLDRWASWLYSIYFCLILLSPILRASRARLCVGGKRIILDSSFRSLASSIFSCFIITSRKGNLLLLIFTRIPEWLFILFTFSAS